MICVVTQVVVTTDWVINPGEPLRRRVATLMPVADEEDTDELQLFDVNGSRQWTVVDHHEKLSPGDRVEIAVSEPAS